MDSESDKLTVSQAGGQSVSMTVWSKQMDRQHVRQTDNEPDR